MAKIPKKLPKNWLELLILLLTVLGPLAQKAIEKILKLLSKPDLEKALKSLKAQKGAGTISQEEYEMLRKKIIDAAKPEHL